MRVNLDAACGVARAEGLMAALAPRVGRVEAVRLVEAAVRHAATRGRALAEVAQADEAIRKHLDAAAIEQALDPVALTATARDIVRRSLRHREVNRQEHESWMNDSERDLAWRGGGRCLATVT